MSTTACRWAEGARQGRTPAPPQPYGFWVQDLSYKAAVREIYEANHDGADLSSDFTSHFDVDLPDAVNTAHHLVVVATGLDVSTEQIVEYVRGFGVPINVLFFQYLRDGDREYPARSWLGEPNDLASRKGRTRSRRSGRSGLLRLVW
jgi:hypothetical protein